MAPQRKLSLEEILDAVKELPAEERKTVQREIGLVSKAERIAEKERKRQLIEEGKRVLGDGMTMRIGENVVVLQPRKFERSGRYGYSYAGRLLIDGHTAQVSINIVLLD